MRQQGQITDWKDDKGFGFVAPLTAGAEQAFVHINSFLNRQRRPVDGDVVTYEAVQDFQKRWQAQAIRYVDEQSKDAPVQDGGVQAGASPASHWSALPLLRVLRVLLVLLVLGILGVIGFQVMQVKAKEAASGAEGSAEAQPALQAPWPA